MKDLPPPTRFPLSKQTIFLLGLIGDCSYICRASQLLFVKSVTQIKCDRILLDFVKVSLALTSTVIVHVNYILTKTLHECFEINTPPLS